MEKSFHKSVIAEGVSFYGITNSKFKHNRLSIFLTLPLAEDTVSGYALLPFLMRRGCQGFEDFTKLNRELDELYGAALVSDVAKSGCNQLLTFSIQAIDDRFALENDDILKRAAEILCDMVLKPLIDEHGFPQADLDLEKQNLIDTINSEINDKRSYAIGKCRQLMDGGRPTAIKKYGSVEKVSAITSKMAGEFYQRAMAEADIRMMMVGTGNEDTALKVFTKHFGKMGRKTTAPVPSVYYEPSPEVKTEEECMEVVQCKLTMGLRIPEQTTEESRMAAKLMNIMYGVTVSSKLFLNVREKYSLCYYCASRYDQYTGVLLVDSGVELQNVEKAKNEILKQLDDIKQGIISDHEMESAKLALKNSLRGVEDSLSGIESWYLSQSLIGREREPREDFAVIDGITKEMIANAAKQTVLDSIYLLRPER